MIASLQQHIRYLAIGILTIVLLNCSNDPEYYIPYLNGYWEIDEVILNDGGKRDYSYNDTIDFIEVTDSLSGTRRKLKPTIYGTYETSKHIESFHIKLENDSLNIYYETPYSNWKETVLKANENQLTILNSTNKDVYIYKRYEPMDINLEE